MKSESTEKAFFTQKVGIGKKGMTARSQESPTYQAPVLTVARLPTGGNECKALKKEKGAGADKAEKQARQGR